MSCCASRSARPGSPGSSTRSATGSCGLRVRGAAFTRVHSSYDRHNMAKKDKKKDKSKDDSARTGAVDAVEALRAVVERTFAEGAQSTRERAADIVTEVAQAAASVRGLLEDLRVADDVRALRADVEALSARVTALERAATAATAAPATTSAAPARRSPRTTASRASGTTASRTSRSTGGASGTGGARATRSTGSRSTTGTRR